MSNVVSKAAAAAILALIGWIGSSAVNAADLKIGFVSTERVLRESGPAVRAQIKLKGEFAKREAELNKMEKQIRDAQAVLDREGTTISESDRKVRERELSNLTREFQRSQRTYREDSNSRMNEELGSLQERADKIIKQIADQEKFDLILQEPVVWASPRIDITDRVIKLLADK